MPLPIWRFCNLSTSAVYSHLATASIKLHSNMVTKHSLVPARPIHWILDWDGTITRRDTLNALVSMAAAVKPDSPILEEWKRVSEAYMSDYTTAMERLAPGGSLPKTLEEEKELLRALSKVEQASLDRVSSAGIFAGLARQLIDEGAKDLIESRKVELRTGFTAFIQLAQSRCQDSLDLLSVNWSRRFIGSCLAVTEAPVQRGSIYANELDGIENGQVSRGLISSGDDTKMSIISSGDKLSYFNRLRTQPCKSAIGYLDSATPVVYIGDSWTDIECLLEADLGICIRDEPPSSSQKKLGERLEALGAQCRHISDWVQTDQQQVVWAKDFVEVKNWAEAYSLGTREGSKASS